MGVPNLSQETIVELLDLLNNRSFKNLQLGKRKDGILTRHTIINLYADEDGRYIDGHVYMPDRADFDFRIALGKAGGYEIEIVRSRGNREQEMNFLLDEIERLRDAALTRTMPQDGGPKNLVGLYLQSGMIATDTSKMRFVQAVIENQYPREILEKYKDRNFKFIGRSLPSLPNWKEEADRLGIGF